MTITHEQIQTESFEAALQADIGKLYLAILYGGANVALTFSEGQGAYNFNGGDYALWINRRPKV